MRKTVVILVNYNNAEDTAACVSSLERAVGQVGVIVVDNTPHDSKLKVWAEKHPAVHVIYSESNLGFGRGNNLGIKLAIEYGYQYIFILNNDAVIDPNAIAILEEKAEKYSSIGILAPRILREENPEILWYGGGEMDWRRGGARVPGIGGAANAPLAMRERNVRFASGCAMFIRREAFDVIGGFDPRFFMYEEDLELCLRAAENGFGIRYIPEAIICHKMQGSLRKPGEATYGILEPRNPRLPFYVSNVVRNRLLNMYIHARGWQAIQFAAGFPVFLTWKVILFLRFGAFKGIRAVYTGFSSFLAVRKTPYVDELSSIGK